MTINDKEYNKIKREFYKYIKTSIGITLLKEFNNILFDFFIGGYKIGKNKESKNDILPYPEG